MGKKIYPKRFVILFSIISITFVGLWLIDYFNVFGKIGFDVTSINFDFWDIFIGNGVVIILYIITYFHLDKRTIKKEELGDYAGNVLLKSTYDSLESYLTILVKLFEISENSDLTKEFSDRQVDFFISDPFKENDKLFDCLVNGHISYNHYENYKKIKRNYETLVFLSFRIKRFSKIEEELLNQLKADLQQEQETINKEIENQSYMYNNEV